jgi:hypothetical protein
MAFMGRGRASGFAFLGPFAVSTGRMHLDEQVI